MSVLSQLSVTTAIVATVFFTLGACLDGELMESNAQQHSRQLNWYYYWRRDNSYNSYSYSRSSGYKYGLCNYWWSKWLKCCQIINNDESSSESSSEEDPTKDFYTKRLNCGGRGEEDRDYRYTDTYGNEWTSDTGYSNSDNIEYDGDVEIYDTDDDELYRSSRFKSGDDDLVYYFDDVYDGVYEIKLRFVEIFFNSPGDRTFDIYINDESKEYDVDILATVGKNRAYDIKFYDVQVYDGLEIRFVKGANDPKVSGIEIIQVDYH